MSASREKKQRRDIDAPISSSRAQEEQAKAEKRRRNTIIYTIIGIVVVILAAILLIWDSGVIQRSATVAKIDGEKVTAPQVAYYYYNNQVIQNAQIYSQYGMSAYYPFSLSLSPKDQVITESAASTLGVSEEYVGKTYHDYFLDYALNSLSQEYALRAAAKEAGYTLSDKGKDSVEQAIESVDSACDSYMSAYGVNLSRTTYLQMVYGDSMTARSYRTCLENAQLASEFYADSFDSMTGYSDEELDAYYQENKDSLDTIVYYWRLFDGQPEETVDEDGNTVEPTEEETEAAMAQAEEAANAALAEVLADPDSVKDNEDYTEATGVLTNTSSYYYDWLIDADRKAGDAVVLDNSSGYSVIVFADRYLETESTTVDVRHILISAMAEDDPDTEDVDESKEAPTDEAFAAAKETALDVLEQWKANGGTEEAFAALAEEYSADSGSNTNGGLYEDIYAGNGFLQEFLDWSLDPARVSGDVSDPIQNTVSSTQGWHLIYFVERNEPVWITNAREGKWLNDLKTNVVIERTDKLDSVFG